jgi:hypothetical protein
MGGALRCPGFLGGQIDLAHECCDDRTRRCVDAQKGACRVRADGFVVVHVTDIDTSRRATSGPKGHLASDEGPGGAVLKVPSRPPTHKSQKESAIVGAIRRSLR